MSSIAERAQKIRQRISDALKRRQDSGEVLLVCVTKNIPSEIMKQTILETGITDIGESRVQESLRKYNEIKNTPSLHPIRWHLIGHLQTNKAARAVEIFDLIQSVDSEHLAFELNKRALAISKIQDVLIEVKVSEEDSKYGCPPSEVKNLARKIVEGSPSLRLLGLMAMAPYFEENSAELARPYFEKAREVYESCYSFFQSQNPYTKRPVLSMGMSSDFEAAIAAGSNMVRIGSAIFAE